MALDIFGNLFGGDTTTGINALLSADQRRLMNQQGNLSAAAALLAASGPSRQRVGLGQALGSALQAGQQGYQQARAGSLQDLLLGEKLKEAQAARDVQTQVAGALKSTPSVLTPAQQALAAPGGQVGPTLQRAEMAAAIPETTPNQIKAQQYQSAADILAAAGRVGDAEKYQAMAEKLNPRAEVVGQPFEVTDATGKPILVQQFKDGKLQTMAGFGPKREVVLQNLGGQTVAVNKSALRGGETFQQTMTPGETAANRVALGNLAVAQGGLALRGREFDRGGYQIKETEGGGMAYVPTAPGGLAIPVMGQGGQLKGAGGAPTEGQANAAGYAQRMELAQSIIGGLPAGSQPGAGTRIAEAVPFVGGALARSGQSTETQQYTQAAKDWIRAKLRKESGAVIGAQEERDEYETYFPVVGDTPERITQKAEARRVATLGMQKSAGKAYQPYVPPEAPPAPAATTTKKMVWDGTKFVFQ